MTTSEWPQSFAMHRTMLLRRLNGLQDLMSAESLARGGLRSKVDTRIMDFIRTLETLKYLVQESDRVKAFCYIFKRDGLGVDNIKRCFTKYGDQTKANVDRKQKEAIGFIREICQVMLLVTSPTS
jgi:predicted acetyltransferase